MADGSRTPQSLAAHPDRSGLYRMESELRFVGEQLARAQAELHKPNLVRKLVQHAAPQLSTTHRAPLRWCNICLSCAIAFLALLAASVLTAVYAPSSTVAIGLVSLAALALCAIAFGCCLIDGTPIDQLHQKIHDLHSRKESLRVQIEQHKRQLHSMSDEHRSLCSQMADGTCVDIAPVVGPDVLVAAISNYWTTLGWVRMPDAGGEPESEYVKFFRGRVGDAVFTVRAAVQIRPTTCRILLGQSFEPRFAQDISVARSWAVARSDFERFLRDWSQN